MQTIYLDYNATTPVDPQVRDAMLPCLGEHFGNPSSTHVVGRVAHEAVEKARGQLAELLNCHADEILFTSGGTESSNIAILGTFFHRAPRGGGHLVISALEHPATVEPAKWLEQQGHAVTSVGCDNQGRIDPEDITAAQRDETTLVSIMHANNEIGTLEPISQIAEICRQRNVPLHVDAAQSIGKVPVDVIQLGVDLLTVAGHKVYAPKGIGALFIRRGTELASVLHGASQERGLKPGTENVAYIVGLGAAAEIARESLDTTPEKLAALRDRLQSALQAGIGAEFSVNAATAPRLPNTLSANFPHVIGGELLERIPQLCASTGAACHSGQTKMSATLSAIGMKEDVARGTVRLSVGRYSTETEIDTAARWLIDAWKNMQAS